MNVIVNFSEEQKSCFEDTIKIEMIDAVAQERMYIKFKW